MAFQSAPLAYTDAMGYLDANLEGSLALQVAILGALQSSVNECENAILGKAGQLRHPDIPFASIT